MDIKNNIIKYFKTNHLKLNNIKFDETKGFVLETNKGILTSSNLPLLNYISRNDMEYIKMELNDVSVIDNQLNITKRVYECKECGLKIKRDHNSCINMINRFYK